MNLKILVVMILLLSSSVTAISGVTPGSYRVDFEGGLNKDFSFDFYIDGGNYALVNVESELEDFVTLDKEKIYDREKVIANVNIPENYSGEGIGEIKIISDSAVGYVLVNFGDTNDFFDVDLRAPNANAGDIVEMQFSISPKVSSLSISPRLEIYSKNNLEIPFDSFSWNSSFVNEESSFSKYVGTINYDVGNYVAVLVVNYLGEEFRYTNDFSLGKKSVEIVNYTKELRDGKVGKFEIGVKSLWNNKLDDLYAEVMVLGYEYKFVTPSVKVDPWGTATLEGFFDTREISGYNKKLNIILYYGDEVSHEVVDFKVKKGFDFSVLIIAVVVLGVLAFLIIKGKSILDKLNKLSREV